MKAVFLVSAICLIVNTALAQKVPFKDCGSKLSTITEVDVFPCPSLPCPFKRNTNVTVSINLTPNTAVTDARTLVHGIIIGVPVVFPLPDDNACHFMKCPLAAGTSVLYRNNVFVDPNYPSITLVVKWELTSSSGELLCFTIPVTISD